VLLKEQFALVALDVSRDDGIKPELVNLLDVQSGRLGGRRQLLTVLNSSLEQQAIRG
jgi:hypothetical protein